MNKEVVLKMADMFALPIVNIARLVEQGDLGTKMRQTTHCFPPVSLLAAILWI